MAKVITSFLNYFKPAPMASKLTYAGLIATIIFISSCSSTYKMGQTPDDVYYSPAPPVQDGYVTSYTEDDQNSYAYNNQNVEDLSIRRGISNPVYRSSLSFGYGYMPYDYYDMYGSPFMSPYSTFSPYGSFYPYNYFYPYTAGITFYPYSSYNYFGGFYSPYNYYYGGGNYYSSKTGGGNYGITPRRTNLAAYRPNNTVRTTTTRTSNNTTSAPVRTFNQNPRPQTSGLGNFVRRIFTPSTTTTNNNINNSSNNQRTFRTDFSSPVRSSGGNGGGSSSSGGGGGGSTRSFRR
jgi:hypothetical protein